MNIRPSTGSDLAPLVALFSESVHGIAARSYSAEQREAWAPASPDLDRWQSRLKPLTTLVAERDGALAGFISYTRTGYIEFLFTSPTFARTGVASGLYEAAIRDLRSRRVNRLSTEASIEARPFFESKGFTVAEPQTVERNGVQLVRYLMTKGLQCADSRS